MEIKGKVHEIGETQPVTDKFQKRELVIEYAENPQYPEFIKLEAQQKACDLLDELRIGDVATIYFNLKGRPWTYKKGVVNYFNTLSIWKVELNKTVAGNAPKPAGYDDDLPF